MENKYIQKEELKQKFFDYLHKLIPCDNPDYIEMTIKNDYEGDNIQEFPDPYAVSYVIEEYVEDVDLDGVEYEKRKCHIDLAALYYAWMENGFGSFVEISQLVTEEQQKFEYFKYYRKEDVDTTGSYVKARQLFEIIND